MPEETLTFTLRAGRTARQVFEDAALVGGYEPKVIDDTATHATTYGAVKAAGSGEALLDAAGIDYVRVLGVDNPQDAADADPATIRYSHMVDNPMDALTYGKRAVGRIFDTRDNENEREAARLRLEADIAAGKGTVAS